ncbi:hypothetical protein ACF91D_06700 [Staphylococcus sp. 231237_7MaSpsaltlick]|uniref:hypothetical protein n=1 Tax=Staphylococcus sp. 231237_7MaSpsaltlick TaxID=3367518 RepID=UPI00370A4D80
MMYEDEDFGGQRDYKSERDTLIDDIEVLRANNKRLERENEKLDKTVETCCEEYNRIGERSKSLEQENKALRLQANTYFDEWQTVKKLYNTLTDHIRQKAEANPNVDRYIALVNYIDRLEKGEN